MFTFVLLILRNNLNDNPRVQNKTKNTSNHKYIAETIKEIEDHYHFNPTAFSNGNLKNNDRENTDAFRLFAFAKHQTFTKEATLFCFDEHY